MTSPRVEKEKRSRKRDRTPLEETTDDDRVDRPLGVTVVAALVGIGGLVDLLGGVALLVMPLLGIVVGTIGLFKLYIARGLLALRLRALGWAILLHGVSLVVDFYRWTLASTAGGATGWQPIAGIGLNVVVIAYLLWVVDAFE